jgi:hypothetical protein
MPAFYIRFLFLSLRRLRIESIRAEAVRDLGLMDLRRAIAIGLIAHALPSSSLREYLWRNEFSNVQKLVQPNWFSISTLDPYHLRIAPCPPRSGTLRWSNNRYSPSARRTRASESSLRSPGRNRFHCCLIFRRLLGVGRIDFKAGQPENLVLIHRYACG